MHILRKVSGLIIARVSRLVLIGRQHWLNLSNVGVKLDRGVEVFGNVKISETDGGYLHLKSNASICSGANITVQSGRLDIGSNVFIGIVAVVIAKESINIGDDRQIAEYVVIREQDHRTDSSPIRSAGFHTSPIHIGKDVWIGCKATISRGITIGEHSLVAEHSVVNKDVPGGVLVSGAPARFIKKIEYT